VYFCTNLIIIIIIIARYWSEIATFPTLLAFNAHFGVFPLEFQRKNLVLRKLESWGYQAVKTVWHNASASMMTYRYGKMVWAIMQSGRPHSGNFENVAAFSCFKKMSMSTWYDGAFVATKWNVKIIAMNIVLKCLRE